MCTLLASVHVNVTAVEGKSLRSFHPHPTQEMFALLLAQLLCAACSLKPIHGEVHHQHSMVSVFWGVQQIPRLKLLHWCASGVLWMPFNFICMEMLVCAEHFIQ